MLLIRDSLGRSKEKQRLGIKGSRYLAEAWSSENISAAFSGISESSVSKRNPGLERATSQAAYCLFGGMDDGGEGVEQEGDRGLEGDA